MKNFNLIKRLFMDSHEKQSPQRFARYAAMLIMLLTLGVGQMWATDLYVRGYNGTWDANSTTKMSGTSSPWTFTAKYWSNAGSFKIADNSWGSINCGSATISAFGTKYNMTNSGSSSNMSFSIPEGGGIYTITVTLESGTYKIKVDKVVEEGNDWKDITDPTVYFDNSAASYSNVSVVMGRVWSYGSNGIGHKAVTLSNITNTSLYYTQGIDNASGDASKYTTMLFANASMSGWTNNTVATKAVVGKTSYTNTYNYTLNSNMFLFKAASGSKGASLTKTDLSAFNDLNKTQTIQVRISENNGSTYSNAANFAAWPGSITVARTYLSSATASSSPSATAMTATTTSGALTSSITFTGASTTEYTFAGWSDSNSSPDGNTSKTYTITDASTKYAFYKRKQYTVSYGVNSSTRWGSITLNSGSAVTTTSSSTLNHGTAIAFTASPNSGYQVEGWYSDAACSAVNRLQSGGTSYNAGTLTAATTVYVKFAVRTGGTVTLNAGSNGQVSLDNSNWGASKTKSNITTNTAFNIYAQANSGYQFSSWAKSSGSGTIASTSSASTTFTPVAYEDATVTASFSEIMRTITINGGTATSTTAGVATTGSATAAAPAAGKKFTGWTLGSGVTLSGGALTDRTINFTATANSSVTANYADRASVKLYFPKPSGWSKVHAYAWKESGTANGDWPGVEMTSYETVGCVNYYYYLYYTEADGIGGAATGSDTWDQVIFSNNGATQTNDLAISNGHYYYKADAAASSGRASALASAWLVKGSFNSWGETDALTPNCGANTATKTISLTTGAKTFKIYNIVNDQWWRIDGNISATKSATTMNNSDGDMTLTPSVAGSYIFTVGSTNSTPTLAVTYPTTYTVTYSVSPSGAAGAITTSPSVSSGGKVLSGTSVTFTHAAANSGYTWYRWENGSGSSLGTGSTYNTSISANTTVVAKYTENNYNVTVNASAGGSVASTSVTGHVSTKVTLPTATPNTGYYFTGWEVTSGTATLTSASSANAAQINGMTDAVTVRANFAPIWYLKGDFNSWGEGNPIALASSTSGSVTLTTTSAKLSNSKFKIWNKQTDTYYQKASQAITRAANTASGGWTNGGTSNDMKFNSDVIGDYIFAVTFTSSIPSALTVTYPTAYTVTFGKGTGGGTITASATSAGGSFTSGSYVASGDDVTFAQTASSSGYTFTGWYTTKDTGGSAVTGMGVGDNVLENVTSNKTVWSRYTANTYTVTFDKNGGTTTPSPSSKSVTFGSAYGTLPSGMKHASKTFVGWFTESSGGTQVTAETIVSTASNHTLYAQYESVYAVNVDFKCGDAKVFPSTVVSASPTSLTPTIIAPVIFGYSFTGWSGSNVTFADASNDTTTITATAATTVTANYRIVPTVYFKNNLEWDSVFVTFDNLWVTASGKQVPKNNGKPYYKMTQIGTTDIYYCEIPSTYTDNDYASWAWNIAFDNKGFGNYKTTHTGNSNAFNSGEFLGRGDFDPKATLYIPYNGDTETRNGGKYYPTGCWLKYNSSESGYQVNVNTLVDGENDDMTTVDLIASSAGGYEFTATVNLPTANYGYGFKLYKKYQKNTNALWYTNTGAISASTTTLPWHFWSGDDVTATSRRCELHTEAVGDYTITVSFATGRPMVNVEYPTQVGDWRLAYNDRIAWSGDTHDASWYLYSRVIKAKANAEDLVSFYVSKAAGANAHIELQKCTNINPSTGAETWTKQGSNLDLSSITGTGIYNFKVTQNGSKVATAAYDGAYEGNFYIRTDVSDGGWTNYKNASNVMTYSEYAKDNSGFTHYFMRFVETGLNIKFCIANDYSPRLTEYCIDDDYTGEYISVYGNVRFMWDHRTNAVSRAYISGSSFVADRFLVLEGDAKLFDENGKALTPAGGGKIAGLNDNEMKFIDDQNWIYETTVEAIPGSKFKLTAKYNNKIQYFYGDEGSDPADSVLLLGGSDGNQYEMRIVYDFKTNRLIKAFVPEGAINTNLAIETDLMIIRDHQDDAKQITFGVSGRLSEVKTVYGAMKFNKYTLNGKERTGGHASTGASRFERDLFYISFPFDVKLNEAFGFGTYGKHWIIEYYDGKTRAANGFWADSDPNWKFVTPAQRNSGYTMKAFEGYILALDLDELTESSEVWYNGVENVYIYFPSSTLVEDIAATNRLVTIDQTGYECTINRNTPDGDRRVKDSYWHCIGVPSFANYSGTLYDVNGGTEIDWRDNDGGDLWKTPNLPYLYTINWADKSLSVSSTANFNFQATWSYLVQYEKSSIYWSNVNVTPASIVARKHTAPTNAEFCIELQQAGEKADQTFVRLTNDEAVTNGFDFNYDLSKEFNKNKANIYTMVTTVMGDDDNSVTQAAGNCLPMTEQTTIVPLGMKIAKAGEYTISIPSGTSGIGVTLVDNETGIRTNLALEDYTVALEAGTQNDRFYLEISPITHVATDIENTEVGNQNSDVKKVMVDGILYIIKDGNVFDARGARVK